MRGRRYLFASVQPPNNGRFDLTIRSMNYVFTPLYEPRDDDLPCGHLLSLHTPMQHIHSDMLYATTTPYHLQRALDMPSYQSKPISWRRLEPNPSLRIAPPPLRIPSPSNQTTSRVTSAILTVSPPRGDYLSAGAALVHTECALLTP